MSNASNNEIHEEIKFDRIIKITLLTGGINEIEEEVEVITPAEPAVVEEETKEKEIVEEETSTEAKTDENEKDPVELPEDPTEDDLSYLDNVVIDITDPTVETDSNTSGFSEEYKESLRK